MGIFSNIRRAFPNMWFMRILYGVVAAMSVFLTSWENGDRFADSIKAKIHGRQDRFDFIIVGSGSSGAVVANRLSENPNWKILLLEAGGEPAPFHAIPGFALYLTNYKSTDWQHLTVPQDKACFSSPNRQCLLSQGRSLGGTSNINFMIHLRGHPEDFNNWANLTGDPAWSYEGLLPYFRKSEDFHGEWNNPDVHGSGGPLRLEVPNYHPFAQDFLDAAGELGYPKADLNGYYTEGFDNIYFGTKRGQREAVYRSYILTARRRPNLSIYKYSHVNKILINENNQAYGVEYERHGRRRQAIALNEVILSAGTIQSAKILMLSGIGPAEHLRHLDIPLKADLPVGENLQDHISAYLGPYLIDQPKSVIVDRDINPQAFFQFLTRGQGVLTNSIPQATGIFTSSLSKSKGEAHWPDLQTIFTPLGIHKNFASDLGHTFGLSEEFGREYYRGTVGRDSFTQLVSVGRPLSRGHIRLVNSNPTTKVIIDPKYYDDPTDVSRQIEAIKINLKLVEETEAFKRLNARLITNPLPGCEHVPYRSDEYWNCFLRTYSVSLHHLVGTASMGHSKDPRAVVDTKLRVRGIQSLRVIDASIMPVIPVSNTQAPCIMIGEKGADLIKEAWDLSLLQHYTAFDSFGNFDPVDSYTPQSPANSFYSPQDNHHGQAVKDDSIIGLQVPVPFAHPETNDHNNNGNDIVSIYENAGEFEPMKPIHSVIDSSSKLSNMTENALTTGFDTAFPELAGVQEQVVKSSLKEEAEGDSGPYFTSNLYAVKPAVTIGFLNPADYKSHIPDQPPTTSNNLYVFQGHLRHLFSNPHVSIQA